jgi:carboxyl-terminal processing protease
MNEIHKRILYLILGAILISAASFSLGTVFELHQLKADNRQVIVPEGTARDFQKIADAWNIIQQNYIDRASIDGARLTDAAINGMVDALGDTGHSRFLSAGMASNTYSLTNGPAVGIGLDLAEANGQVVISAIHAGSPAQKAAISAGDIVQKVDGSEVAGQSAEKVTLKLTGKAGSQVQLTLQDPQSGQARTLTLTRTPATANTLTWDMLPGTSIAHVFISSFSNGATNELKKALAALQAQGARGLILDLRNNPGGLVLEAVGVASQFLQDGTVVQERDADGFTNSIPVTPGGIATELPLVVLINQGTASSAEIVSGALQDAGRARLVGETTFGAGTMLTTFPLQDQSAILLATQVWLTPKGRILWHTGIAPDDPVSLPANARALFPDPDHPLSVAELKASQDAQVQKALQILAP